MKPRCILINPWIYDFAAMNLWSRPLGLLKVAEYLNQFDIELKLIDCMDVFKSKKYGTGKYPKKIVEKPAVLRYVPRYYKRYGISLDEFQERLKRLMPYNIIFITSIMSYWYPGIQKAIKIIKSITPQTPIILGGIYATLYYKHASEKSGANFIFRGYINKNINNILEKVGVDIERVFFPKPYYKLGFYRDMAFAPILTSEGCPYNCTYCASKRLSSSFKQRDTDDIIKEIKELSLMGIKDFTFYDDALLVNADSHIKVILKDIIRSDLKIRFHCPNGLHARFIDDELAYLMKESGFITLRLSLETINEERLKTTGGKVTLENIKLAVKYLKKHGFLKRHIGVYLMYGLPGQSLAEVREGVEFLKRLDVRINLTEFSPIPGTQCWKELIEKNIINDDIDPLLTNNSVFSLIFSGYKQDELKKLKIEVNQYNQN